MTGKLEHLPKSKAADDPTKEDWCSPKDVIARAVEVLGGIDFDPCGNPGSVVPATVQAWIPRHADAFSPAELAARGVWVGDGLALDTWPGRIYANPPYRRQLNPVWAARIAVEGALARARGHGLVALVPSSPGCKWWLPYRPRTHGGASDAIVLGSREQFLGAPHKAGFESAYVYFGSYPEKFFAAFMSKGWAIR